MTSELDAADGSSRLSKGERTRRSLIDAAMQTFTEQDYLDTKIDDIAEQAGVSHGTFYTYFDSKEEIFREVALRMQSVLREQAQVDAAARDSMTLYQRIEAANRAYLSAYRDHAPLMAVIEQVATFNDELRAIRREIRNSFVDRATATIARLQDDDGAYADIEPRYAASALGSMVDRFAYVWFVLDEPFEFDEAVRTLTLLWCRAIGVDHVAR